MPDCPYAVVQCARCKKEMRRLEQASHDCVKWLQSLVDNLSIQNQEQNEEILQLHEKGSSLLRQVNQNKEEHQLIQEDLQKKNQFLRMYSQEFVESLDSMRAEFGQGIGVFTREVLEKSDLQVRKNESFSNYVKSLSDLCLDQSQKQTSLMQHYAHKIDYDYVQRQVSTLSHPRSTSTSPTARSHPPKCSPASPPPPNGPPPT